MYTFFNIARLDRRSATYKGADTGIDVATCVCTEEVMSSLPRQVVSRLLTSVEDCFKFALRRCRVELFPLVQRLPVADDFRLLITRTSSIHDSKHIEQGAENSLSTKK